MLSPRPRIILAPAARRDIREALKWSEEKFGSRAAERYRALLKQALRDVAADPERPGSRQRPELSTGARTYHLSFSRGRAQPAGAVKNPRHLVLYRRNDEGAVEVARVLHDACHLERHLPEDYRRSVAASDVL